MKLSEIALPEYFDRYILLNEDLDVLEALKRSLEELEQIPLEKWKELKDRVYAPDKWTLKDILQHIIDTERVFAYRALAFARGEQEVKSYDENEYAYLANANNRSLEDLLEEALILRKSTLLLFSSFTHEMLEKTGMGFKGPYSVHSIGYILGGHQRWHFKIIEERYLPLLQPS